MFIGDGDGTSVRNRKGGEIASDDFQSQLLSEEQRRDKLVEDMVAMTREWKEKSEIANKIIKRDVEVSIWVMSLIIIANFD